MTACRRETLSSAMMTSLSVSPAHASMPASDSTDELRAPRP